MENSLLSLPIMAVASIAAGCSIGFATFVVSRIVLGERQQHDTFEQARREKLRSANGTYRKFEPLVDELSFLYPDGHANDQLEHHLRFVSAVPWKPAEFLAVKTVEAIFVGIAIAAFITPLGFPLLGCLAGLATGAMYPTLSRNSIINRARGRMKTLKLRIPFAIDQISLMMEAGAGFEDSLRTVVSDNQTHPLSVEFSEIIRQMSLGRPRSQALGGFRDRLADPDVSEIVFAITKGEELGTPLSSILREQATQMRLKRSQWGEKAASEAEVKMVFPGMITMVACLLVIVAPILLPVVSKLLEGGF